MSRDLRVRDLILGTMKSAKSAQLIMKGYLLDSQGKKVITFKPETDTRDGDVVASRALPIKRPAIVVPRNSSGIIMSHMVWKNQPEVILIDELQFFTVEQVEEIAKISLTYNVDIYAYGLMMSYNGRMFESIKRAIECGFRITTLDMSCDHCNNDATHHALYLDGVLQTDDSDGISVEDLTNTEQVYESLCYSCYQRAVDAHDNGINKPNREEKVKRAVDAMNKFFDN